MKIELVHPVTAAENELAEVATPEGRIIVGVDDSPGGQAALRLAVARARSSHVRLVAVRSWALGLPRHGGLRRRRLGPVHPHIVLHWEQAMQSEASRAFVRRCFLNAVGGTPRDVAVTVETPEGEPGAALTGIAGAGGDVIVVGQESPLSVRRVLHGSVSHYCRTHAPCPVVVVPAEEPMPVRKRHDRGPTLTSVATPDHELGSLHV
jgi:nucleotide-binding universal stress UspA family protein